MQELTQLEQEINALCEKAIYNLEHNVKRVRSEDLSEDERREIWELANLHSKEQELNDLCDKMIANIEKNSKNLDIEKIRKSENMYCDLATL